jgi:hypothetical protein
MKNKVAVCVVVLCAGIGTIAYSYVAPPAPTAGLVVLDHVWEYEDHETGTLLAWDGNTDCDNQDPDGCNGADDCSAHENEIDWTGSEVTEVITGASNIACFQVTTPGDTVLLDYCTFADWTVEMKRPAGSGSWGVPNSFTECPFDIIYAFKAELAYGFDQGGGVVAYNSPALPFEFEKSAGVWKESMPRNGPDYTPGQWMFDEAQVEGWTGATPTHIKVWVTTFNGLNVPQVENTHTSQTAEFQFTNPFHQVKIRVPL